MVLLTGGTGLIGSHILYELLQRDKKVRVLIRNEQKKGIVEKIFSYYSENPDNFYSKIEWVKGDILDIFLLDDAMQGVDEVYHTAAMVSFNPALKKQILTNNIVGTRNVVNAALENSIKKFGYISSVAALGRIENNLPIDESTKWSEADNNSNYSVSKYQSELEVWRGSEEGLKVAILNPSVVLGPGKWKEGSSAFFEAIYNGLRFYPSGATGFTDVRDVAKIMVLVMENELFGERYIINSANLTYRELFTSIATELDIQKKLIPVSKKLTEIIWRLEKFRSLITRREPLITKETARSAHNKSEFSNQKIGAALSFNFIPIAKTIHDNCAFLKADIQNGYEKK